jgi:hypothetical protein
VLDANDDDFGRLVADSVKHPVGATAGRPQAGKLSTHWSSHSSGLRHQRRREELNSGSGDGLGKPISQGPTGRGREDEFETSPRSPTKVADRFYPSYDIAPGAGGIGLSDVGEGLRVAEHRQGLLQLGEVLGAEQYRDLAAFAGDGHPLVVLLNPVDQLGQVVPNGSQRLSGHGHNRGPP